MKIISFLITLAILCIGVSASAQHNVQLDRSGTYSIIQGANAGGPFTYTLPPGGGAILTTGGTNGWLTAGNPGLTDGTNNFLGTLDNIPLRIVTGTGGPNTRILIAADGTTSINTGTYALTTIGNASANTQLNVNGGLTAGSTTNIAGGGPGMVVNGGTMYANYYSGQVNGAAIDDANGNLGLAGIVANFAGDLHVRSFWGVSIDKYSLAGLGNYTNGVLPGGGDFAIRTRITNTTFRTDMLIDLSGNTTLSGTLAVGGSLSIGGGGNILREIKPGGLPFAAGGWTVPAGGTNQVIISGGGFRNLNLSDAVIVEFDDPTAIVGGLIWNAGVSASNGATGTVYINLYNPTGAAVTIPAGTLQWYTIIHQ